MIQAFYHFKTMPFQKDIKGDDIFFSAGSRELFERLEYMKERRGIMLVTGMPGTGKTLHLRAFVEKLNRNLYEYFYFPLSTVNTLAMKCLTLGSLEKKDLITEEEVYLASKEL